MTGINASKKIEPARQPDVLEIREIREPDVWDRYVLRNRESGYTHLFNWSKVIEKTYDHRPVFLSAIKRGQKGETEICGIMPLFRFKTWVKASRVVSIPFFDTAGILAKDALTRNFLFKKGLELLIKNGISDIELRQYGMLELPDLSLMGGSPRIFTEKVGLSLPLSVSPQAMMHQFKSKLRSQIKKSHTCGLDWKIGKKELIDPFYKVFSRNMRDLGSPVHAKKFFEEIFRHFYHHAFICTVFYKKRPVAAAFMFRFKKRLANPWASSIREFRYLNANLYLYWQMIRFACHLGMEAFDMGRSSRGAATFRFKKQFGPCETPLYWYSWSFKEKNAFQIKETLSIPPWRKMPLGIANLIGPVVRKRISL